jgi:hypothetical protein
VHVVFRPGRRTASKRKCGTASGSHSLRHTRCTQPGPSGECAALWHEPRGAGAPRECQAASRSAAAVREPSFEDPPPGQPDAAPKGGRRAWPGGGGPPTRPPARPQRPARRREPTAHATPKGRGEAAPGRRGAAPCRPSCPPPGCQANRVGSAPGGSAQDGGTGPIGPPDPLPCRSKRGRPRGPHGVPQADFHIGTSWQCRPPRTGNPRQLPKGRLLPWQLPRHTALPFGLSGDPAPGRTHCEGAQCQSTPPKRRAPTPPAQERRRRHRPTRWAAAPPMEEGQPAPTAWPRARPSSGPPSKRDRGPRGPRGGLAGGPPRQAPRRMPTPLPPPRGPAHEPKRRTSTAGAREFPALPRSAGRAGQPRGRSWECARNPA